MPEFPQTVVPRLHDLATRLLDSRKTGTPNEAFARSLLIGFEDVCAHAGLDGVLSELPDDVEDDPAVTAALVAQLSAANLDSGGPRNARTGKVVECVLAALGLTVVEVPDRSIALDASVRAAITAAVTPVIDAQLAPATLREAIVAHARAASDPAHTAAFTKIVAALDDRGLRMTKQPKVPLDASQPIQRHLHAAREAVLGHAVTTAVDRAKVIIAAADPGAAERIDQPISLRLTPREVLIARVCDDRASKVPESVVHAIIDGLAELTHLTWRVPEVATRPYGISQTYAVGDVLEHPKFGRGTVVEVKAQRIDVEFADSKVSLVHARK